MAKNGMTNPKKDRKERKDVTLPVSQIIADWKQQNATDAV